MGASYFLLLSCLGLAITAQGQDCDKPIGGPHMNLNGNDILSQTFPDGTKVTFVCEVGYVSAGGSGTITCTAGNWSPVRLKCERKNCGSIGEVENGAVHYPTETLFGDKAVITCDVGYRLVGRNEIICGAGGWLDRLPVCEVVTCDPPPPVVNGAFSPDSEIFRFGEVVQYKCDKDYILNGSKVISCSENGKFNSDPPTCIKVNCKEPNIPNAVWNSGARPPYGHLATVTYKCKSGYVMTGSATLKCEINSQWSPGFPNCTRIATTPKATTTTPAAPTPTPTPTTTTTTTTTRPYSTKKPTAPGPTNPPENKGNNLVKALGITFGVIICIGVLICGCRYFGVPGCIKKKKKRGARNGHSDKEAAKDGEGLALS